MDEDVAGLNRVLAGNSVGECARCGAPIRRRRTIRGKEPHEREFLELCERCYREGLQGEEVPTPEAPALEDS